MTTFLDGPAKDAVLMLKRSPLLLRVVRDPRGEWDALDQLDDTPRAEESIAVYARRGEAGSVHICSRGRRGAGSGWFSAATYLHVAAPPPEAVLRDTARWREWCQDEARRRGWL
jgi:hypothetical protein